MKEALLYQRLPGGKVRCDMCAHRCVIFPGQAGICRVRENEDGTLYSLVYGRTAGQNVDPVEKKPLFHFYPGSTAYSITTVGCNFHCHFCQNWAIAQAIDPSQFLMGEELTPEQIVNRAIDHGCKSVAYTYTEPTVFMEYALDTAAIAHEHGLKNIFVTNGYETPEAVELIRPYLDAANVDLKSFNDSYYRKVVGATLQPVLETIRFMKSLGIWLEVTTLVVPGQNDAPEELREIARFLARDAGTETPWHISRFFPGYKMSSLPPTELETLTRAREIGLEEGLPYVYVGNIGETDLENTHCPNCKLLLIDRSILGVAENRIRDGACPRCGRAIPGVGLDWLHLEREEAELSTADRVRQGMPR
jgi:pyruvate formate lyase activating enzyme